MTEVERLISDGRVSRDFFRKETRCDFSVDEKRKKIWAIELDLLTEFDRVCKKYDLKYFVGYGSLLGVVRHKGFIPWDDDLDVVMFRKDYERLIEIGSKEFSHPYFLQSPETEKGYFFSFAKLRNSNTSAISFPFRYEEFNQGVFIDIFVLDNSILDDLEVRHNRIKELIIDNSTYMRMSDPNPTEKDRERIKKHSGRKPSDVYGEIMTIAKQYNDFDTEYVSNILITMYSYERMTYKKSMLKDIEYMQFEGIKVPIPKEYDYLLKIIYGDYMQLPEIEDRGKWHSTLVFEPDVPYKEFIKTLR